MGATTRLVFLALLGLACACGGGGERADWEGLEHTPLDYVPPPDRSGDGTGSGGNGGSSDTEPVVLLQLSNFEPAIGVVGQPDFKEKDRNQGGANPTARTLDAHGRVTTRGCSCTATSTHLWVADQYNNRILRYPLPLPGLGPAADIVLGQLSMTTRNWGVSEGDFFYPTDVAVSGNKLLVCDMGNNRVVIYDHLPTFTGDWGQIAVGQPDLTSNLARTRADGMINPMGICVAGNKLLVADTGNRRVLIWNTMPAVHGSGADLVLGQPDFTSSDEALTATGMKSPTSVWSDGTKVVVCDSWHHRVLIWNTWPTRNGQPADLVLGQPDMTSTTTNQVSGIGWPHAYPHPDVFWHPHEATSNGVQIVVADSNLTRVLIWDSWPTTNHQRPDFVLGQSDFYHGWPNDDDQNHTEDATASDRTVSYPTSVEIVGRRLYVSDNGNNRVLVFE